MLQISSPSSTALIPTSRIQIVFVHAPRLTVLALEEGTNCHDPYMAVSTTVAVQTPVMIHI
jgi:hypothetical protein